jgi:hypothetical protein
MTCNYECLRNYSSNILPSHANAIERSTLSDQCFRGWQGLVYIGRSINPKPLDQTNLNGWRRCNLGGAGEPT